MKIDDGRIDDHEDDDNDTAMKAKVAKDDGKRQPSQRSFRFGVHVRDHCDNLFENVHEYFLFRDGPATLKMYCLELAYAFRTFLHKEIKGFQKTRGF